MQFSTKIPIEKTNSVIDYNSKIMSLGSCFAENIGAKFDYFKFQNTTNPFGIIFNPVSIEKLVDRIVNKIEFTEKDIFFHNDLWHCYEVHSELSNPNKEEFLQTLNSNLSDSFQAISNATNLIITYGTSWVYRNKTSENIVANCHKVPQNQFDKEILSVEIIQKAIQHTIDLVQKINPNCNFIFTNSPVRHIKDGFVQNQRSKAHLITALHSAICNLPFANYFPSYEIMMDELRDYRFYADDMLHPNHVAINYIWERFVETTIDEKEFKTMKEVESIQKDLLHKSFNPNTEKHQKFLAKVASKIKTLQIKNPEFTF
jgi:hypothetical protein